MNLLFPLFISALIQLASAQDNDGNDFDTDQVATLQAFGNVIIPIKGNTLVKKNIGNSIKHVNEDDEGLYLYDVGNFYLRYAGLHVALFSSS